MFELVPVAGFDPEVNDPEFVLMGGVLTLFQLIAVVGVLVLPVTPQLLPVVSRLDCHILLSSTLRFLESQLVTFHCS